MKYFVVLASILFIIIFGITNYYIGLRGWQNVGRLIPFLNNKIYWVIFWIIALSYLISKIGAKYIPASVESYLSLIGVYWIAAMMYFIILLPIIDIVRFLGGKVSFIPISIKQNVALKTTVGFLVFFIVIALVAYGSWNAKNAKVVNYDINIQKSAGSLKKLNIVMVSDIHLGDIVDNKRLQSMVEEVNAQKPDLVLLVGDIVDEKIRPYEKQHMEVSFSKLQAKYGVYAVTGNHEYIGGEAEQIVKELERSGIKVLRDNYVKIDDAFYLVGREDIASERFKGTKRKTIDSILEHVDKSKPIILMDHQPKNLAEAQNSEVDLQVSGHTHKGQMFPNEFFTGRLYEIDWGYLKKGNLNVIVSLGYGTWGPPIRIGNSPEIVRMNLTFQ
jgi:predicted MPP superfamily phosphohydrolase